MLICAAVFLSVVKNMVVGFDYGSSNCAMGMMQAGKVSLIPLEQDKYYLPSSLYAQHNLLIVDYICKKLPNNDKEDFLQARRGQLSSIPSIKRDLALDNDEAGVYFGREAIEQYISFPEDGFYVKSPKSFFGAVGLKPQQIAFFEDIATAMIMGIKAKAEQQLGQTLTQTVIGRPVNFQAIGGDKSNQQALTILENAAKRAGFKDVEFLFEPLAAGIDFETSLTEDKKVLVIDIGGGTTDCSFVNMGPGYRNKSERAVDFLAHSGKRIGGNDLDIAFTFNQVMPTFGMGKQLKSGLPMPKQPYWQACKINDLHLQSEFYSASNRRELVRLLKEVEDINAFQRLIQIHDNKQSHQLVREAELAKIALTNEPSVNLNFDFIEPMFSQALSQTDLHDAISDSIKQIINLVDDAIKAAGSKPDVIYLTGGSAQSPILKNALNQHLGDIKMLNGDNFGSVTAGLTKWADKIYK